MQPPTNNPASLSDPTNAYLNDLGPQASATPTEEVNAPAGGGQKVTVGQIGKSGTYLFNGIITREDYNPDMMRWELLKNIDIMRRSDATVQALLEAIKLPILGLDWSIQAGGDDDIYLEHADWVRHNLFEANIVFADLLQEILTFQDFGYSVFEKVWDYMDWEGKTFIGLKDLQSRKQRSIYRWQTNETTPRFGITQYVPGGTYSVPGEKLVVFTRKKEGENYEGISVLRASYKHWKIKDALELIEAIRHERQGLGVIEIIPPEGANEDDVDDAIENARQARASEEGVIKHPKEWSITFMDMKAGSAQNTDIQVTLEYHKREMMKSVLAQFLEIGSKGGSGSRAASSDHHDLFDQSLEFMAKYVGHVFNRSVIKELIDLNYGPQDVYPTLEHSKVADDDITSLASALNQLSTASLITPDPELEQWVRNVLHAPDLPDDIADDYQSFKEKQNPAPVVAPPVAPGQPEPPKADSPTEEEMDQQTKTAADAIRQIDRYKGKLIDTLLG